MMYVRPCSCLQTPLRQPGGTVISLAGLVLEIAGEFPQVNEEVSSGDFIFIPLDINKNRIGKVKVIIKTHPV